MQEPSLDDALGLSRAGNPSPDPVTSEIRALLQRVRASIHVVETAMRIDGDEPGDSDDFFILDDITPVISSCVVCSTSSTPTFVLFCTIADIGPQGYRNLPHGRARHLAQPRKVTTGIAVDDRRSVRSE